MSLPFSVDEFLAIFESYNQAVWPAQILAYLLAALVIVFLIFRSASASRWTTAILAALWLWTGVMYHITFFSRINPVAIGFGTLFVLHALLLVWAGLIRKTLVFRFRADTYGIIGGLIILYATVIYPLLGIAFGHVYPRSPAFGIAPCPLTIFTFGLLLWAKPPVPATVVIIPLLWALIGTMAAFSLGIREDLGMLVSAILGAALIWAGNRKVSLARPRLVSTHH